MESSPWRHAWFAIAVSTIVAACSGTLPALPSDSLGSNGDGAIASMGHERPDDGIVTFGILVIWNQTDRDLTLVDATVVEPFGSIELFGDPKVVDEQRVLWSIGSYNGFPQDPEGRFPPEAVHDLQGFVLPPADERDDGLPPSSNTFEILIGLRADDSELPAGILGACVTFRDENNVEGQKCVDHQLVICEDTDDCPIGAELEDYMAGAD